jgi:hypothetical protein
MGRDGGRRAAAAYGVEGESEENGWFLGVHCLTKYVKVAFFHGTSLRPVRRPCPRARTGATSTSTRTRGVEFTQEPVDRYGAVDAGFRDPSGNRWKMIEARRAG